GSIDLAFLCDTLHHIENRAAYLANVRKCLKPAGRLAIIDFSTSWPENHASMRYSLEELERWTAAAGLRRVASYDAVPGTFFQIYKAGSSDASDGELAARIRDEGMFRSQILRTMHFLTDVYGPRLTGSPNLKAAGQWAIDQMKAWGFENGHLEPWEFG